MPIAETILSASLQVLFDRLASSDLFKFAESKGIDARLREWNTNLCVIRNELADAEEMEPSGNNKLWLDDLRGFAYDAEDLLDEIATEAFTSNHPNLNNMLRRVADFTLKGLNPTAAYSDLSTQSKLDSLTQKLQDLVDTKNRLRLLALDAGIKSTRSSDEQAHLSGTTSKFDESSVCGRGDDKKSIIQMLFSGNYSHNVIVIVGMGGMGKTTLAQLVFHDNQVKSFFNLRIWVHVSQDFSIMSLTKSIVESIIKNKCDGRDLNWLQDKLEKVLSGKKFLIVLDDVWNEFYDDWQRFCHPFRNKVHGSKFIVTARNQGVASIMGVAQPYHLQQLSDDQCLSIFVHHALGASNFDAHPHLQSIGSQIVKNCHGCPLVAMALGGILHSERDPKEWRAVLDEEVWDSLKKVSSSIVPGLMLSYQLLPSHLKRCFAYCSLFPKSYLLDKDELVRLWMAEGFLPQGDKKRMKDVGSSYFNDLLSRSFFQRSSRDETLFEMHDLISDLCQVVADDVFLHLENKLIGNSRYSFPQRVRHTSFSRDTTDVFDRIQSFDQRSCFRTLLALTSPETRYRKVSLSEDVLDELLPEVRRLRVLSLNYYVISELPGPVCYLRLLRYLNLSGTPVKCLPDVVSSLINLQTLLLNNCYILMRLPHDIENLVNLRDLEIADTPQLQEMPAGIGKLGSLQKLSKFIVGENDGLGIRELGNLFQLQGDLFISGLHNVVDDDDAKKANLQDKDGLVDLSMEWSSRSFDGSRNYGVEMEILKSLQPHVNLKKLMIKYYAGPEFASWIGHPSFICMETVKLYDCRRVTALPSLGGLPFLIYLSVRGLHRVRSVGSEFYGDGNDNPFQCLQTLRFEDMQEWEHWVSSIGNGSSARDGVVKRDFPCLRVLEMVKCPKLIGKLPEGMMSSSYPLERLEINGCPSLVNFPDGKMSTPALKQLIIRGCPQLECITKKMPHFCTLLERIEFSEYTNLKSIPVSPQNLIHLVKFSVANCPSLESFPQSGLFFPNLKELSIGNCDNLKSLPNHMKELTSLQSLHISKCQSIVSFPEGGFPPNLNFLSISKCTNIHQPMAEWGLHSLSSLQKVNLDAVCLSMISFPEPGSLPSSITCLFLSYMKNLEYLSDEMQELKSLEYLRVDNCPMFHSMECDLPPKLNRFSIIDCPHMQHRCRRINGDYWQRIAHIRLVEMIKTRKSPSQHI